MEHVHTKQQELLEKLKAKRANIFTLRPHHSFKSLSCSRDTEQLGKTRKRSQDGHSIDYGQIDYDSDGTRVFKFKNVGDAPLVFTRISSSCGCTIPKKPEKPIEPGGTGQIEVNYDTSRVGVFRKAVTVNSNAKTATVILRIMGEVLEEEDLMAHALRVSDHFKATITKPIQGF